MIRRGKSRAGDSWRTDAWILDMFSLDLMFDPCPLQKNPDLIIDGLLMDWFEKSDYCEHRVFVNPPYSNPLVWVEKAIEEHKKGCKIIMLLKHDSSTEWYRLLHSHGAEFLMFGRRLKHGTNSGASFPSILAVLK
tara:strand:- start:125 stop:529 length:405 start_codon:yes stop_codon:yes gene_type:complete